MSGDRAHQSAQPAYFEGVCVFGTDDGLSSRGLGALSGSSPALLRLLDMRAVDLARNETIWFGSPVYLDSSKPAWLLGRAQYARDYRDRSGIVGAAVVISDDRRQRSGFKDAATVVEMIGDRTARLAIDPGSERFYSDRSVEALRGASVASAGALVNLRELRPVVFRADANWSMSISRASLLSELFIGLRLGELAAAEGLDLHQNGFVFRDGGSGRCDISLAPDLFDQLYRAEFQRGEETRKEQESRQRAERRAAEWKRACEERDAYIERQKSLLEQAETGRVTADTIAATERQNALKFSDVADQLQKKLDKKNAEIADAHKHISSLSQQTTDLSGQLDHAQKKAAIVASELKNVRLAADKAREKAEIHEQWNRRYEAQLEQAKTIKEDLSKKTSPPPPQIRSSIVPTPEGPSGGVAPFPANIAASAEETSLYISDERAISQAGWTPEAPSTGPTTPPVTGAPPGFISRTWFILSILGFLALALTFTHLLDSRTQKEPPSHTAGKSKAS